MKLRASLLPLVMSNARVYYAISHFSFYYYYHHRICNRSRAAPPTTGVTRRGNQKKGKKKKKLTLSLSRHCTRSRVYSSLASLWHPW